MRIIALADTHIKSGSIMEALPADLVSKIKQADIVMHAGDFVTEQAFDELRPKLGRYKNAKIHWQFRMFSDEIAEGEVM